MWSIQKSAAVILVWKTRFAYSAINFNDSQSVASISEDDSVLVPDARRYHPDQYDCPIPCADYSNIHTWTPYLSVGRLRRCSQPMLLQFSVTQLLNDPASDILIRTCVLGSRPAVITPSTTHMSNPKKASNLFHQSLDSAPACVTIGIEVPDQLELATNDDGDGNRDEIIDLLQGMQKFFDDPDNCDENFLFAQNQQTIVSIYIGAGLHKRSIESALQALTERLRTSDAVPDRIVAQRCGHEDPAEAILGISIDNTGDLAAVQQTALEWSKANCAIHGDLRAVGKSLGVKVFEIARAPASDAIDAIAGLGGNNTHRPRQRYEGRSTSLDRRATCRHVEVVSGDSCASLVARCGTSAADFVKYNSKSDLCATLAPGDFVCCSSGTPYRPAKPDAPKPNADGVCAVHLVRNGDTCDQLAKQYGVTINELETWNQNNTWAWNGCQNLVLGYNMCLSAGTAPLPPPQQGAECGPLVPGTKPLTERSLSMASLNPCPLKACCSNWGFCGVFPAHCEIHAPDNGGPGSVKKGHRHTCISNCGTTIRSNSPPPTAFQRIGYYQSDNLGRECLWLKAKNANTDGTYTHFHWSFLDIDPNTWKPVVKDPYQQWNDFKALPNVNRIVSLGGWAHSTEPATFNIIRSAIIDHRDTFVDNLAQFVQDEGIDGIDIDWEYPGVSLKLDSCPV
jgi:hypothetical protein